MAQRPQKAPAYQWYPKDYDTDEAVKLMTYEEEGIYRRLLDHQWLHGGIPAEIDRIARLVPKVPASRFRKLWPSMALKFERVGERLVNRRLERQRGETGDFSDVKSLAGTASAEARREKYGTAQPHRTHSEQPVRNVFDEQPRTASEPASSSASPSTTAVRESESARVIEKFRDVWKATYGYDCSLILKPLQQMDLDRQVSDHGEAQIIAAVSAFFTTDDPYVRKAKHPLALFLRDPLRFLAKDPEPPEYEPWLCPHDPPCGNRATCAFVAQRGTVKAS